MYALNIASRGPTTRTQPHNHEQFRQISGFPHSLAILMASTALHGPKKEEEKHRTCCQILCHSWSTPKYGFVSEYGNPKMLGFCLVPFKPTPKRYLRNNITFIWMLLFFYPPNIASAFFLVSLKHHTLKIPLTTTCCPKILELVNLGEFPLFRVPTPTKTGDPNKKKQTCFHLLKTPGRKNTT